MQITKLAQTHCWCLLVQCGGAAPWCCRVSTSQLSGKARAPVRPTCKIKHACAGVQIMVIHHIQFYISSSHIPLPFNIELSLNLCRLLFSWPSTSQLSSMLQPFPPHDITNKCSHWAYIYEEEIVQLYWWFPPYLTSIRLLWKLVEVIVLLFTILNYK